MIRRRAEQETVLKGKGEGKGGGLTQGKWQRREDENTWRKGKGRWHEARSQRDPLFCALFFFVHRVIALKQARMEGLMHVGRQGGVFVIFVI